MSHMAHPSCACAAPSSVSERVVFAGHAEPHIFIADEEANVAIGAELARMMHSVAHSPSDTPDATRAYIGGLKRLTAASWRARSE